jgi:hypothetical protein
MERITTSSAYEEAKHKILQYELDYIPKFYGKVDYTDTKGEKQTEYFQSLNELVQYCQQLTYYKLKHTCQAVTYREWDENYLPF